MNIHCKFLSKLTTFFSNKQLILIVSRELSLLLCFESLNLSQYLWILSTGKTKRRWEFFIMHIHLRVCSKIVWMGNETLIVKVLEFFSFIESWNVNSASISLMYWKSSKKNQNLTHWQFSLYFSLTNPLISAKWTYWQQIYSFREWNVVFLRWN